MPRNKPIRLNVPESQIRTVFVRVVPCPGSTWRVDYVPIRASSPEDTEFRYMPVRAIEGLVFPHCGHPMPEGVNRFLVGSMCAECLDKAKTERLAREAQIRAEIPAKILARIQLGQPGRRNVIQWAKGLVGQIEDQTTVHTGFRILVYRSSGFQILEDLGVCKIAIPWSEIRDLILTEDARIQAVVKARKGRV